MDKIKKIVDLHKITDKPYQYNGALERNVKNQLLSTKMKLFTHLVHSRIESTVISQDSLSLLTRQ